MPRRRPLRDRLLGLAHRGVRAARRRLEVQPAPTVGPAELTLDTTAVERAAAEQAIADHPSLTLDSLTHIAYQDAYPAGPTYPDFYDDAQMPWIYAWVRIRNWVDYFRHRPGEAPAFAAVAPPYPDPRPLQTLGVPFAGGVAQPTWPVVSSDPRGCDVNYLDTSGVAHGMLFQRFGAPRGSSDWQTQASRYHIGHDCIANPGDLVVAPEAGVVGKIKPFYAGTHGLYLWTDSGLTLVLGEIEPGSPAEFGVDVGSTVAQGDAVARIGTFDIEAQLPFHMLHFETHEGHLPGTYQWHDGEPAPPNLRNPTDYLLRASCSLAAPELGFAVAPTETELKQLGAAVMADPDPAFPH